MKHESHQNKHPQDSETKEQTILVKSSDEVPTNALRRVGQFDVEVEADEANQESA
jgi:hypothetical protein